MESSATKQTPAMQSQKESAYLFPWWGFKQLRTTPVKLFLLLFSVWAVFWNLSTVQNGKIKDQIAELVWKSPTTTTVVAAAAAASAAVEGPDHVLDFFRDIENATAGGLANSLELARDINSIAARYLVREPRAALQSIVPPPVVDIDCKDPLYAGVLTGNAATREKYMIDIVPFGFDVDYLEIRLMEYFDLVDKFVIIEQSTSHKGVPKKFLIPELLESSRFSRFKSKIEYVRDVVPSEILNTLGENMWAIESRIRSLPVEHLRKTMPASTTNAFVTQNDGDEFITRRVMAHFKSCESGPRFPIYTPATIFKRNAAWVQQTYDMVNMPIHNMSLEVFRNVLWRPGPLILRYDDVLEVGSTGPFRRDANAMAPNFGLGAANHISTPSHPILSLLKHLSTGDSAPHQFSPEFWPMVRDGTVSNQDIMVELFECHMTGQFRHLYIDQLGPRARTFLVQHLPWAVRDNPSRYPWLYSPTLFDEELELFQRACD
jgi:hypothetical protein